MINQSAQTQGQVLIQTGAPMALLVYTTLSGRYEVAKDERKRATWASKETDTNVPRDGYT